MPDAKQILIVGGGIAGLSAARAARETDPEAEITLVCGEKTLPYYRTRILETLLGLDEAKLPVMREDWYENNAIQVRFGRVTALSRESTQVRFADGSCLPYDRLVLATGSRGIVPEILNPAGVPLFALRTLEDVRLLSGLQGPLVVLGGGVLGLETAWALSRTGSSVTLIGRGRELLMQQLDHEASVFLLGFAERAGIRVALHGDMVELNRSRAVLADGRAFDAAAVICCCGVRSVTTLAPYLDLDVRNGFMVDARMQTSHPAVFAAGDCAEFHGIVSGRWSTSIAMGKVAGANAAGAEVAYTPVEDAFSSICLDTMVWSCGRIKEEAAVISQRDVAGHRFAKFFVEEGKLTGAELIGQFSLSQRLARAIASGLPEAEVPALWQELWQEQAHNEKI